MMKETKSMKLPKKLLAMIEDADFSVTIDETDIDFGKYSRQGQDFHIDIKMEQGDTLESIYAKIYEYEDILDDMKECKSFIFELSQIFERYLNSKRGLKRLNIKMAYTYVGNTYIDVPKNLSLEEAMKYAQEHLGEIPIAPNAEYIPDSDTFDLDNCSFEEE